MTKKYRELTHEEFEDACDKTLKMKSEICANCAFFNECPIEWEDAVCKKFKPIDIYNDIPKNHGSDNNGKTFTDPKLDGSDDESYMKQIKELTKKINKVVDDYCIKRGVWSY